MKRKILLLGVLSFLLISVKPVLAVSYGLNPAANKAQYDTGAGSSVYSIVEASISAVLGLIGFVFFGLITMAGIRWMTARGNEELVSKAKETLSSAIWGLIITIGAYAITNYVFSQLSK
ncbi:MAG: hypothetical protein WC725_03030 [Patescibacteria group bacterium]|jgi:hypothetical protein